LDSDFYVSVSFASDRPLSVPRFQEFLDTGRPAGLFRAKGFISLAETGRSYVFHLVGSRLSMDEDDRPVARNTRIVLIGRGLVEQDLRARLQDCVVSP
jgi:G3E family GTPase